MRRIALLAAIAVLLLSYHALGLDRWLTLDALKSGQASFAAWYEARPALVVGAYFLLYAAITALSLPVAAAMTLAGGALFGLWLGTLVVSFASSIGATLAFLASRFLLRDWVQARFGGRLAAMNAGMARDGAFYLFALRLVPLFPFFAINLAMGLTPIRARTFYWVSQLGMLAGTLAYVNAGTQLARVETAADALSPALIASFALLGILPLLAKKLVDRMRAHRAYRGWKRPRRFERDLVVIGAGAAGLSCAYAAASLKAKVTLVESGKMGGDCLNRGCVPSKALLRTARLLREVRRAGSLGVREARAQADFGAAMARVREIIGRIEPHDSADRYAGLGVEVVRGRARIVSPWQVAVEDAADGRTLATRAIVIATGGGPAIPDIPGIESVRRVTSDTVWELAERPARLVVLGAGPVGCELAQAFAVLGSEVTQVARSGILGKEDADVVAAVEGGLRADGVRLLTGAEVLRCEVAAGEQRLVVRRGGAEEAIPFDLLLCAVGRQARVAGLGLEALGIPLTKAGTVEIDECLRTRYPNIYACGDVAGPYQFTHFAAHQAWHAAANALLAGLWSIKADERVVPRVTFTSPEAACVGLTETEAQRRGIAFEVTRYALDGLDRAITDGEARGFVKVLTPPGRDAILGVAVVGDHAGEMLAEFTLAMRHGLGLNGILATIHPYPTWGEAARYAAGEWKRAHAPQRLLSLLARWHAWRRG